MLGAFPITIETGCWRMTKFDTTSPDIIAISYPPGGFGHFMYHVLTHHCVETVKVNADDFEFGSAGDAHQTTRYVPTWNPREPYVPTMATASPGRIVVLCDHGWAHDSVADIRDTFPQAQILRMVIDDMAEPVIYHTYTNKTGQSLAHSQHVQQHWPDEPWAHRENYTLWYHSRPFHFGAVDGAVNINISQLLSLPTTTLVDAIQALGLNVIDLGPLARFSHNWLTLQEPYVKILKDWSDISFCLDNQLNRSIEDIQDLHDQGYINYRIEQKFGITIPVYDYRDWFCDIDEIATMIEKLTA